MIVLGFFLSISKTKKQEETSNAILDEEARLRKDGQKIILDIDCCEFKQNNFQQEIEHVNTRARMLDASFASEHNYETSDVNNVIIIYNYQSGSKTEKFVSGVFSIDEVTLKFHIMNGSLILYVDRFDRSKYFFDLLT